MDEYEPEARLSLPNGEVFIARRDTASIYTFMGNLAVYNHIFCYDVQDNEVQQSFYIFNFVKGFRKLYKYMLANDYPAHLNMNQISKSDTKAYERAVLADIDTSPPWLPEV